MNFPKALTSTMERPMTKATASNSTTPSAFRHLSPQELASEMLRLWQLARAMNVAPASRIQFIEEVTHAAR